MASRESSPAGTFGRMKSLLVVAAALVTLSCHISPVVTDPGGGWEDSRYSSCRRAAADYCRHALDTPESEMKACVAERAYQCTSGKGS